MVIRVDKCSTFGIKKSVSKSVQYLPKLIINNVLIPTIKIGETFVYLGRYFDFNMTNQEHKCKILSLTNEILSEIDLMPLHPKNKLSLYSRYVLPKMSWHFTVATVSKTWVIENVDSLINKYIRKWLEIPISGTLSNLFLTRNKFGLNILPASVKFTQCQSVLRNALRTSPNESIKELWRSTSNHTNIQYDNYSTTKDVLRKFRSHQEDKLKDDLKYQGTFHRNISKFSLSQLNPIWSISQSKLPKNIFNFTIRYMNNTLPTRNNLSKWGISSTSDCSFCLQLETLLHVVAGCQKYLDRFTWRHDSILNFLTKTLSVLDDCKLFVDLPGFESPSIVTGDEYRPDLLLLTSANHLYIVELTVGFESNLTKNTKRKHAKYKNLTEELTKNFTTVKLINLSISSLGVFDKECQSFVKLLSDLGLDKQRQHHCYRKIISIAIRATYYIFCRRNKEWENPELMNI